VNPDQVPDKVMWLQKGSCFPQGRGGRTGPVGGGGTPHMLRHMGRGVIPSPKINGGGVGGSPPSPPLSAKRLFFCTAEPCVSRGITTGTTELIWLSFLVRGDHFGPVGGGGTPHLLRHMGGGVTPSGKINGGGVGGPPPSPPCADETSFPLCFCSILHAAINGQKVLLEKEH